MKWRFDIMMVCGIKDGYQPLIAVQGSGQLSFMMTMKRQKFFSQIKMCGRPKLVE